MAWHTLSLSLSSSSSSSLLLLLLVVVVVVVSAAMVVVVALSLFSPCVNALRCSWRRNYALYVQRAWAHKLCTRADDPVQLCELDVTLLSRLRRFEIPALWWPRKDDHKHQLDRTLLDGVRVIPAVSVRWHDGGGGGTPPHRTASVVSVYKVIHRHSQEITCPLRPQELVFDQWPDPKTGKPMWQWTYLA